jgi:hypothetical protein
MRLYVTDERERNSVAKVTAADILPQNLSRSVRYAKPNVQGLIEQAVEEGRVLGRLGVGVCGSRALVRDVKNEVVHNLNGDFKDIYCHAEDFEF